MTENMHIQAVKSGHGATARRLTGALLLCAAATSYAGTAAAQTGYVSILGGGPTYAHNATYINELKTAGYNELIVWSVEVNSVGDLNLNGEFPLTSGGVYVGNATHPYFPSDLATIKQGAVKRVTFSVGSSNYGDWEDIRALVNSQGTGPDSILYKDFAALKAALAGGRRRFRRREQLR